DSASVSSCGVLVPRPRAETVRAVASERLAGRGTRDSVHRKAGEALETLDGACSSRAALPVVRAVVERARMQRHLQRGGAWTAGAESRRGEREGGEDDKQRREPGN